MRFAPSIRKWACTFLSVASLFLVVAMAGCGETGADSPEAKEARRKQAAAIREDEEQDQVRTRSGKKAQAGVMKSIKGRLGGDAPDEP
jgi:hypothetical protein